MSRSIRRRTASAAGVPVHARLATQEFARRLQARRGELGLSHSDVARRIWGGTTDGKGYPVAKNRDRLSNWENGKQVPSPENLALLAGALETTVEALAPDLYAQAVVREEPELAFTQAAGHPGCAHLLVNKLVPAHIAAQVVALLSDPANQCVPVVA